jgi:hypothetical protein
MNLYGDIVRDDSPKPRPKYAVGDKIRITKKQKYSGKAICRAID